MSSRDATTGPAGGAAAVTRTVIPSRLEPSPWKDAPAFAPMGEYRTRARDMGYVEEEWFASGTDDEGRPYLTQVFVRRPSDPARFSGTVLVEPLHGSGLAPIYMYASPYILRAGHAWVCVASLKQTLEQRVKAKDPERYAALHIEAEPGAQPGAGLGFKTNAAGQAIGFADHQWALDSMAQTNRYNQASNAILAQTGAALREGGPFTGFDVRKLVLIGHSHTGMVLTHYLRGAHATHRLAGGAAVYDGYFPAGHPTYALGPSETPVVQLICDGDVADADWDYPPTFERRQYRRPDSDAPDDRFRLYEVAGMPHMGSRYPPHNDASIRQGIVTTGPLPPDVKMNSLPHHEMFMMGLKHLVDWVETGEAPPRGARLQLAPGGRLFAKDAHGNTLGGVRCVQMDVPHAKFYASPPNPDGTEAWGTMGSETPFTDDEMRRLYGGHADYVSRFNARLDELIAEGWFLSEDAAGLREEAENRRF